jgi:ABC-type Fe3+ transport system substrate-binding protein
MTMGHDKGMDYLKKLSQQKIANIPTNQRVVLDQNIAGQYPLVLSIYNYHAAISASQGAPVEWLKLDPTIVTFGTMILLKNSPHPNAAKLFVEFNASEEGQAVYREAGYIPVHPKVAAKTPALRPDSGKYPARIISPDTFNANEAEWIRIYKELFQ